MKPNIQCAIQKVEKSILSCKSKEQLNSCYNLIKNFSATYRNDIRITGFIMALTILLDIKTKTINS